MKFLDCNKDLIKKGCIVSFNAKLEDGSIKRLYGEIIEIYRDPYPTLCVAIDDENCCIIPPRHVSIVLFFDSEQNDNLLTNEYSYPNPLPAYPLKKY